MLFELLSDFLTAEPEIEVVARAMTRSLPEVIQAERPEVVVLGGSATTGPEAAEALLERFPRLSVIVISADAREATRLRLVREEEHLHEVSPSCIAASIRRLARGGTLGTDPAHC